jgi:hydroxyacylglutathione hydrolase
VIIEQFYLDCLSQASYLIADEGSRRAVVVDPRRDVEPYLAAAGEKGLRIELVVLTHVHADFVPGHTELAERTGAEVAMSELAPVDFPVRALTDGEVLRLGDPATGVSIEVLATPGHTPESVTLAVREHAADADPAAILTGDTLFLGDVGRPDLLGAAGRTPEDMARELYRSLHERILPLPDAVRVYPGHGAGSACGKALSSATVSTLGEQRAENYALAPMSEDEFVRAVTDGLGEPPAYFAQEVATNRAGHDAFDPAAEPPALTAAEALARRDDGVLLLDVRDDQVFAAGHLRGSVNVGLSGRFAEFAAAVRAPDRPVVLIGAAAEVAEARLRLARVGVDAVTGVVTDLHELSAHPELTATQSRLTAAGAAAALREVEGLQVLDVRNPGEFADGALPGAVNRPLPRLREHLDELDRDRPVLVNCAGGYRSSVAASLLRSEGFRDVSDLLGGWQAWEAQAQAQAQAQDRAQDRDRDRDAGVAGVAGRRGALPLDRGGAVPLWAQLEADLQRRIRAGAFDLRFPGELELVEEYGISRHTVRDALRRLRADGVLESSRGRGTWLRRPRIEQPMGALYSLFRSVEALGLEQRSEVRALDVRADEQVAGRLGLPPATELVYLERLRLADAEPLALDRAWLPRSLADPLLGADFRHTALYDELAALTGVRLTGGREEITSTLPDPETRRLLGVSGSCAAMEVRRLGLLEERPVEWRETVIRGDRFSLTAHWSREQGYRMDVSGG